MSGSASSDPRPIRLLHQMARSGGTLISRCLACMADIMLLSEVHARATGFVNPLAQAQDWFGPFSPDLWVALQRRGHMSFTEAIGTILAAANERGQHLVLREWSHLDFTGVPFLQTPAYRSLTVADLGDAHPLLRFATVRHPLDQFLSAAAVPSLRDRLVVEDYMYGYRRFAEMATATGYVSYEAFCERPSAVLQQLCGRLALPFDPTFGARQFTWTRITGDHPIAGSRMSGVPCRPAPRPCPPPLLDRIANNADYRASLALLGYEHDIASAERAA